MKNFARRFFETLFATILLAIILIPGVASGQEKFPDRAITVVVALAAGGGQDMAARAMQPHMQNFLGQPVVIINKPGGGASIGHAFVMNSKPDGYTIIQATVSIHTLEYVLPSAGISYKKFDPIIFYSYTPSAMLVRPDSPWNNLKELIDYAKANPGKLRLVSAAPGGVSHLAALGFEKEAGLQVTHLTTKGIAASLPLLMGGHVDAMIAQPGDILPLVKGGKLKMLAIAEPERSKFVPDVPTFKEFGVDVVMYSFFSFLGPKGIPKERIKIIHDAAKKAMETKEYKEYCEGQGLTIAYKGPEEFARYLDEEDKRFEKLVKEAGIKPE
jgi:tripartite-type tricarboxylate transporter receptor subunit TctC